MKKLILYLVLLVPLGLYAQHEQTKEPLMTKEEFKAAGNDWFNIMLQRETERNMKVINDRSAGYELERVADTYNVRTQQVPHSEYRPIVTTQDIINSNNSRTWTPVRYHNVTVRDGPNLRYMNVTERPTSRGTDLMIFVSP